MNKEVICQNCGENTNYPAFVNTKMVCQKCFAELTSHKRKRTYKIKASFEEIQKWNMLKIRARITDRGHSPNINSGIRMLAESQILYEQNEN
ncbi:MAG: hypothetical protein ACOCV1_01500 [Bacillota bacterium]